jgi:hypothetical protein
MSTTQEVAARISAELLSWPGVESGPGRFGATAFRVAGREIGHLHGDHAAHFSFPRPQWRELLAQGRIEPHPVFPDREGPAARRIADGEDVDDVIELFRLNYERVVEREQMRGQAEGSHGGR